MMQVQSTKYDAYWSLSVI